VGGPERIAPSVKVLMMLWYLANRNSFREIADKFNVTKSCAHNSIFETIDTLLKFSKDLIKWPSAREKLIIAEGFYRKCSKSHITGAVDGCHIKMNRPQKDGNAFLNRKGYYSIILQGICDNNMKFLDIYVGAPGSVHDARVLRKSTFFNEKEQKLDGYSLLGDSAYSASDFKNFIITPKKDYGNLDEEDVEDNMLISRGRVVIENSFGRLKCKFRRLYDLQNTKQDNIVKVIIAACALHNFSLENEFEVDEDDYDDM